MATFKLLCDGLPPHFQERAKNELGETDEVKAKALQELRTLIKEEPDFEIRTDDLFLLRFLRAKKYDVASAFKNVTNYYKFKARHSGVITDFTPADLKPILDQEHYAPLEYRDQSGDAVGYIRVGLYDINKYSFEQYIACKIVPIEYMLEYEVMQISSYSIICDCSGLGFKMIKFFASPSLLYTFATAIQDVAPCRVKAFHFINEPFYAYVVHKMGRSLLSKKMQNRVFFHGSNLKTLHDHISPDILPKELGGKQGPVSEYFEKFSKIFYSQEDKFVEAKKYGYKGETLAKIRNKSDSNFLS